jgi:hypothetical protein
LIDSKVDHFLNRMVVNPKKGKLTGNDQRFFIFKI